LDISPKHITYEQAVDNNDMDVKMNYGYDNKISTRILEKLNKSLKTKYSLLGFLDKINKYMVCNNQVMVQMLWEAKINVLGQIAIDTNNLLEPYHMLTLYLFTMDTCMCKYVNDTLLTLKESDIWTSYVYCLYQGLHRLPSYEKECYRKVDTLFYYPIGTTINWDSFGVTTSKWTTLKLDKKSTIFIIKSKTGKDISSYSKNPQNSEVIFSPGCKFMVADYYINDIIVFGQENIRQTTFKAKDKDIQKVIDGKSSLIVELHELSD